jgi:hypothetical protein
VGIRLSKNPDRGAGYRSVAPIVVAVAAILNSFTLVWALTYVTDVSSNVQFLIALVGLGVAIDYALLMIFRFRDELRDGNDVESAVVETMNHAGRLSMIALPLPLIRFDWNLELLRFTNRVGAYLALMNDRSPSTDEQQSVQLDFGYSDAKEGLNRWLPLIKWFLAIPHYVVLFFLYIGVLFVVIGAWFSILFTGRYPRGLFDYVEGVIRWHNRVVGYAFILVTDGYPPFRLRP